MNSILNNAFYLLLLCISFSFGMYDTPHILTDLRFAILQAPTVNEGAAIFNNGIHNGSIPPTLINTRWCIYTLADKMGGPDRTDTFKIAQTLVPELAQQWLADYLISMQGFEHARIHLLHAIRNGNPAMAAFLLRSKNILLANTTISTPMITNVSATLECASYNRPQILRLLLETGADQKAYSSIGRAAIHEAIRGGFPDVVEILLTNGIDPDYPELQLHYTPLILLTNQT